MGWVVVRSVERERVCVCACKADVNLWAEVMIARGWGMVGDREVGGDVRHVKTGGWAAIAIDSVRVPKGSG